MEKFLSFNLGTKDIAVISLQEITEVIQVPLAEICCVPEMRSCVLGIYNWRGEMLWLVNLEEMLGYNTLLQQRSLLSKMMTIVLENKGKYLGLLVRQMMDIEWLDTQQMKPLFAELFSPEISPLLQGYFIDTSEKMMLNLDASAIIHSPMWKIDN